MVGMHFVKPLGLQSLQSGDGRQCQQHRHYHNGGAGARLVPKASSTLTWSVLLEKPLLHSHAKICWVKFYIFTIMGFAYKITWRLDLVQLSTFGHREHLIFLIMPQAIQMKLAVYCAQICNTIRDKQY